MTWTEASAFTRVEREAYLRDLADERRKESEAMNAAQRKRDQQLQALLKEREKQRSR